MPTTQELVTTIIDDYAPDLSVAAALAYLNRAHKAMVNQDCAQNEFYHFSDTTFAYPFLNTTADTLHYEIIAANLRDSAGAAITLTMNGVTVAIRRIVRIFTQSAALGYYSKKFRGEELAMVSTNPYWGSIFPATWYYEMVGQPFDRTNNQAARFLFAQDPGTHADKYYVQSYIAAPELSTVSDKLFVDGDQWEEALIDGTVGYWEDVQHGSNNRLEKFRKYWMPKYAQGNSHGARTWSPIQMNMRECL